VKPWIQPPVLQRKQERNERHVITDATKVKMITGGYYRETYANKLDNLKEVDRFTETNNLISEL
jgi:hypothetical protein